MPARVREWVSAALLAMWGVSLFLPMTLDGRTIGAQALIFGWAGFFAGSFGWLANLALVPAHILSAFSARPRFATFLVLAAILSLCFVNTVLTPTVPVADYGDAHLGGAGYVLWMAAVLGTAIWLVARCVFWRRQLETI